MMYRRLSSPRSLSIGLTAANVDTLLGRQVLIIMH